MQRKQMVKPKAEQGKISSKEFKRQLGHAVFLSFFCTFFGFIPVLAIINHILGDIPGLYVISGIITYGLFQTIFYKMAKKGKLKNWEWNSSSTQRKNKSAIGDINTNPMYKSISSNIFHHNS